MNYGNGHDRQGDTQLIVAGIVVFVVAAVVTGVCAKYLYDWATGSLVTENSGEEVLGGIVVGVIGLTGLFTLARLLMFLYDRWAK